MTTDLQATMLQRIRTNYSSRLPPHLLCLVNSSSIHEEVCSVCVAPNCTSFVRFALWRSVDGKVQEFLTFPRLWNQSPGLQPPAPRNLSHDWHKMVIIKFGIYLLLEVLFALRFALFWISPVLLKAIRSMKKASPLYSFHLPLIEFFIVGPLDDLHVNFLPPRWNVLQCASHI